MADFFGGLMKGLSGFMPQDDPEVKILKAQTEVSDYEGQVMGAYADIGKKALELYGVETFGELAEQLKLAKSNLESAKVRLSNAKEEKLAKEKQEREEVDRYTCSECGIQNPEGTKFCQECGNKLGGVSKVCCTSCGAELEPGVRFCGDCGAKQGV